MVLKTYINKGFPIRNRVKSFGSLKLKLSSFVFFTILLAISAQNLYILPLVKEFIEKKSIEISVSTIDRISDFSLFALLERTYENRLSLDEMIKKLQKSGIDGVVGVSIYQKEKLDGNVSFTYLSGFGKGVENLSLDEELLHELGRTMSEDVSYKEYMLKTDEKNIDTYRFIKPLIYQYQGKNILLGVVLLYYDITSINKIIEESIEIILTSTLMILLIATLFAYYIGSRFTRPILDITEASESISKGDLNIHLNINTNDEVENLAYHFNAMVEDLQERRCKSLCLVQQWI